MVEGDDVDLERQTGDLLGFDPGDRADAVRRVDHVITNRKLEIHLAHLYSSQVFAITEAKGAKRHRNGR